MRLFKTLLSLAALAVPIAAAVPHASAEVIEVDARLSQRLLREGQTQNVFLRIGVKGKLPARETQRTPANVVLVIDRSGSMRGDRMQKAKEAAIMAIDRLSERDIASVVIFDNKVDVLVPAQRVDRHDVFRQAIATVEARGSTAIYAAMQEAVRELRRNKSDTRVNRILLMSDGLANVGPSKAEDFAKLGRELGGEGISVTTIGLGSDYNEDLMSRLATSSDGSHAFARTSQDLTRIFNSEFDDVLSVAAQDLVIKIDTRNGVKPLRSLGRESSISGESAVMRVAQVYGSGQHSLQFELEVPGTVAQGERDLANIELTFRDADGKTRTMKTRVSARFSASDNEVTASIDAEVMEAIVELQSRARTEEAIKLRDAGRIPEAKAEFKRNAEELNDARIRFRFVGDARVKQLEDNSLKAANEVENEGSWNGSRKQMRQDQSNAPAAVTAPSSGGGILRY